MAAFDIFPDAELLTITILRAGDWGTFSPTIDTKLPDTPDYVAGVVTVQRVGGLPVERHRVDHPSIQFDVWADTKKSAHDVAARALWILLSAATTTYALDDDTTAVLTAIDPGIGLSYIFDAINLKPRYTASVYLTDHSR